MYYFIRITYWKVAAEALAIPCLLMFYASTDMQPISVINFMVTGSAGKSNRARNQIST